MAPCRRIVGKVRKIGTKTGKGGTIGSSRLLPMDLEAAALGLQVFPQLTPLMDLNTAKAGKGGKIGGSGYPMTDLQAAV